MKSPWGKPEPEHSSILITHRQYRTLNRRYRAMRRQHLLRQFGRPVLAVLVGGAIMSAYLFLPPLLSFGSSSSPEVGVWRGGSGASQSSVSFRNCAAARAAGAAPIRRGQPGYASHLDADGDGIACEWYWKNWFR